MVIKKCSLFFKEHFFYCHGLVEKHKPQPELFLNSIIFAYNNCI